ncbi:hypothetical protein LTS08_007224 [Lithohypha guttulata]|uniref:DNA replication regulator SLD2 n=1 Tax=Lithohypha guttulata TaxID=1690604 RepID=A0AAN7T0Z4_9EURO|nr:hypothetical protein LTR05_003979 [Lithohypha guttulata]KAK5097203.1 hypothetical protein LTS08_007224 [Lithohypha guttulata]
MDIAPSLLDTPRKTNLQCQSAELRLALKDYERTFTEQYGRKPKNADIRNDAVVAAKYKHYQRVQDVLAGKLAYEKLVEVKSKKSKSRTATHSRQDSGCDIGSSPRRNLQSTPRKRRGSNDGEEEYGTPQPRVLYAIGPTPHRDGKVLGLFDLLQQSASKHSLSATPSSSARKRKIEELYLDTPLRPETTRSPLKTIQTPSGGRKKHDATQKQGDLLDYLSGTPQKDSSREHRFGKHSRTPVSEGKKFHLNQFFATPSTRRFLFAKEQSTPEAARKTPLRDSVLGQGMTPHREPDAKAMDVTPAYLKRSTSFKDRLLGVSASRPSSSNVLSNTNENRRSTGLNSGPPTLRHFRSSTNNVLKHLESEPPSFHNIHHPASEDADLEDHDDELDALRDLENDSATNVLVDDSQLPDHFDFGSDMDELDAPPKQEKDDVLAQQAIKPYKKKGQKRTTRRANIRPVPVVQGNLSVEPKFVAVEDSDDDEDDEAVEETQLRDGDKFNDDDDDVFEQYDSDDVHVPNGNSGKLKSGKKDGKSKDAQRTGTIGKKRKKQAGMINPNAQSHTNYRSLKIKNKNSKAKGAGSGRFRRSRK